MLLPLATGIGAFAQGRPDIAAGTLAALVATEDLVRIGGSNAQREIFEDTLIAAYLAVGDHSAARGLLDERLARRASPIDEHWKALATVR